MRTYKNFKYWSEKKLREVIDNPNHCGIDGHDYGPYIEDMKMALWDKENKRMEKLEKMLDRVGER